MLQPHAVHIAGIVTFNSWGWEPTQGTKQQTSLNSKAEGCWRQNWNTESIHCRYTHTHTPKNETTNVHDHSSPPPCSQRVRPRGKRQQEQRALHVCHSLQPRALCVAGGACVCARETRRPTTAPRKRGSACTRAQSINQSFNQSITRWSVSLKHLQENGCALGVLVVDAVGPCAAAPGELVPEAAPLLLHQHTKAPQGPIPVQHKNTKQKTHAMPVDATRGVCIRACA
jgi:hypothetical protein